jgi:hypothetical protein
MIVETRPYIDSADDGMMSLSSSTVHHQPLLSLAHLAYVNLLIIESDRTFVCIR